MITSSVAGEGKTTVALALAQNMAGLGKRVLLVEGDIRRRIFAEYFNVTAGVSLLDAMADPANLDDPSLYQPDLGVDLLVATKAHINAADLFASEKFRSLIVELRQRYDFILIDTPPVLAVPDARVIAPQADCVLYIVQWNSTTRTQVRQGLEMFSLFGLKVAGLVLSKVDAAQMKRYGYGGQYGYDAYRSKYYDS
jgi:capsular exopolysaccharide synthesis family protein